MLRVGLTGGIGSGKSTVAAELAALGARVVDADTVAREVVEPGTPALAAVVERFGPQVLTADGTLDRPALGRLVFGDPAALRDLEAITHPAIWRRTAELVAAAPADAVVVHDMPLLVEKGMAGEYHLVVVVAASEEVRLRRLVDRRGMAEADARARIGAQADDAARRAAADVWLLNEGPVDGARGWRCAGCGTTRIEPFEDHLRTAVRSRLRTPVLSLPDPTWPAQAARLLARVRHAVGDLGRHPRPRRLHGGAGPARQGRRRPPGRGPLARRRRRPGNSSTGCARMGLPRGSPRRPRTAPGRHARGRSGSTARATPRGSPTSTCARWGRRAGSSRCSSATGCGPRRTSVRPTPQMKSALATRLATSEEYAEAKEPWFDQAWDRSRAWAARTGWAAPRP